MELIEIIISAGHDYWVEPGEPTQRHGTEHPREVICEANRGLVGDRYCDGKPGRKGQVTFMDVAVIAAIREQFNVPELSSAMFRRNLLVGGADLSQLLGQRFELQGVQFEGTQECQPCEWMDRAVAPGVKDFLSKNFGGGLRAKVLTSGTLRIVD